MKNKVIRDSFDMAYKASRKNNDALLCMYDDTDNDHIVFTANGESIDMIAMIIELMKNNQDLCSIFSRAVEYHNSKQEGPK